MKVAVTSKGAGLGAWLDPEFEKSLQIVIIDDSDRFTSFQPQLLFSEGRPGVAAAKRLVAEGVDILVTGSILTEAGALLRGAGVSLLHADSGSILELVEKARNSQLGELTPG